MWSWCSVPAKCLRLTFLLTRYKLAGQLLLVGAAPQQLAGIRRLVFSVVRDALGGWLQATEMLLSMLETEHAPLVAVVCEAGGKRALEAIVGAEMPLGLQQRARRMLEAPTH